MRFRLSSLPVVTLFVASVSWGQGTNSQIAPNRRDDAADGTRSLTRVPTGVILVKGAWASASDAVMPVPEGASLVNQVFSDRYFGISYALPSGWTEKFKGPPPFGQRALCAGATRYRGNIQQADSREHLVHRR